jgi:acyl carrier protein
MNEIQVAVTTFLRDTLRITVNAPDEDLIEQGRLDSLGLVELLYFLEQRYSLHVDLALLELDQLSSVAAIARLVDEHGRGQSETR